MLVNNIFLYKLFIGVKKINGHSGVNFSFKIDSDAFFSRFEKRNVLIANSDSSIRESPHHYPTLRTTHFCHCMIMYLILDDWAYVYLTEAIVIVRCGITAVGKVHFTRLRKIKLRTIAGECEPVLEKEKNRSPKINIFANFQSSHDIPVAGSILSSCQ